MSGLGIGDVRGCGFWCGGKRVEGIWNGEIGGVGFGGWVV